MTFTRSASGIANSSLFFGSDRTVYVEGDGSDERFWREVFHLIYKGPLKFHFKSVGSRTAVLPYAQNIACGITANAIAIMDSDFELLKCSALPIKNIVYSYGYSYENDLLSMKQAIKITSQFHAAAGLSRFRQVTRRLHRAMAELAKIAQLDLIANINGDFFLPKNGNTCRLNIVNKSGGVICRKSIVALRASALARGIDLTLRPSSKLRAQIRSYPSYRWVYGHLWKAVFTRCLHDELLKSANVNINSEAVERLAVSNISSTLGRVFTVPQFQFYTKALANIH